MNLIIKAAFWVFLCGFTLACSQAELLESPKVSSGLDFLDDKSDPIDPGSQEPPDTNTEINPEPDLLPSEPEDVCGNMNEKACEMFELVNAYREENGRQPLIVLSKCVNAAQSHAEDMADNGYFSHHGLTETWFERMQRFELTGSYVGENIATGTDPISTLNLWINSEGHRNNILNTNYRSTGIGYKNNRWVQCFSGFSSN